MDHLDSLMRLTQKIEWAKQHIVNLEAAWEAFFKSGGYVLAYNDDPDKRERSYYVAVAKDIPPSISLIAGDAIHNLRSSLDHIAHHLVVVGTQQPGPFGSVYFPIFETASKYKAGLPGKVKGMRQDAIDAITAIEPYGGGKGEILWQLHCLNNIDKHQLLLTVYGALFAHSMLPTHRQEMQRIYVGSHPGRIPPDLGGVSVTASRFPVKQGDVLLTIPHSEMEQYMNFTLGPAESLRLSTVSLSFQRCMA
jgi:hypothetical protein